MTGIAYLTIYLDNYRLRCARIPPCAWQRCIGLLCYYVEGVVVGEH